MNNDHLVDTVVVPSFTASEQNKDAIKSGKEPSTHQKILKDSLISALDGWESYLPEEDMILICTREKISDDDYKFHLAIMPASKSYNGTKSVTLGGSNISKKVLINFKSDLVKIWERLFSNKAFL